MASRDLNGVVSQLQQMAAGGCGPCDAELLKRFAATGDETAFELLVRRHERMVLGVCRRLLPDFRDVEDCFQAVFLALARKAGSIAKREALAGWLYRVAFRCAMTARTKWSSVARRTVPLAAANELALAATPAQAFDDSWQIIDDELRRLPPRLRLPLILCYLEGRTVDEAAREIGCPRGTVASRLARGRSRLRKQLIHRGVAPGAALAIVFTASEASTAQSHSLISSAIRLAHCWNSTDGPAQSALSERVVSLTQEVLRAMSIKKMTTAALFAIATAGLLLLGGTIGFQQLSGADDPKPPTRTKPLAKDAPDKAKPDEKGDDQVKHATVIHPVAAEAPPTKDFTGRLEAAQTVDVVARADGRLEAIRCKTGASVKKGDILFEIDSIVAKENVMKAEANLAAAQARLAASEADYQRVQALAKNNAVAREDVERKATLAKVDSAAVRLAEVDLMRARRELDATHVTAPIDGVAGRIQINAGGPVSANKTVLTTIQVLSPMQVVFEMDQDSYLRYQKMVRAGKLDKEGSPLLMNLGQEEGWSHKGKLISFDDRFDAQNAAIRVHGIVPNPNRVMVPGMSVTVRVEFGPSRRVVVVPYNAVLNVGGKVFVWVVADGQAQQRVVETAETTDAGVTIEKGLNADDWVVIEGGQNLQSGDHVETKKAGTPKRDE